MNEAYSKTNEMDRDVWPDLINNCMSNFNVRPLGGYYYSEPKPTSWTPAIIGIALYMPILGLALGLY